MSVNIESNYPKLVSVVISTKKCRRIDWGVQISDDYVVWLGSKGYAESWLKAYTLRLKPSVTFEDLRK